jgi:CRISPR-associated protein Csm4
MNMPTYAVYLKPKSSFVRSIGSDTLFGALCWALRALNGVDELGEMLKRFKTATASEAKPPFAISSAFPFLHHDSAKVRFYARPLIAELDSDQVKEIAERERQQQTTLRPFHRATVAAIEKAKQVNSASYVSEELFTRIVRGETDTFSLCKRLVERGSAETDIVRWGSALVTYSELKRTQTDELDAFEAQSDVQHNEIERVGLATVEGRLFFTHETFLYPERAGLWFVVRTDELDSIKPLLRYIADTGIGGERSAGKGHFDIPLDEIHELNLPCADKPNCFITLSRHISSDGECDFNKEPLAYTLTTIRPKHEAKLAGLGHHTYKRLMRVFEPGSILPYCKRKDVYGQFVNVGLSADTGGFEAYHSGLAVPVFAKI